MIDRGFAESGLEILHAEYQVNSTTPFGMPDMALLSLRGFVAAVVVHDKEHVSLPYRPGRAACSVSFEVIQPDVSDWSEL